MILPRRKVVRQSKGAKRAQWGIVVAAYTIMHMRLAARLHCKIALTVRDQDADTGG